MTTIQAGAKPDHVPDELFWDHDYDLLRGLVTARYDDERPLNDGELLGTCYLLYIGGLDTVYSVLGWIMRHLATDQPLQARLGNHPEDLARFRNIRIPAGAKCEFHAGGVFGVDRLPLEWDR